MIKISDRHQETWNKMAEYFTFTPNSRDIRAFQADMKTLHPTVLKDSIEECIAVKATKPIEYTEQRSFIHKVYNRRIKEFAAVYPLIFTVENALRSNLADHLETLTGRMDWWVLIRDAVVRGDNYLAFSDLKNPGRGLLRGVPVTLSLIKTLFKITNDALLVPNKRVLLNDAQPGDKFYYVLSLGELWQIVDEGWATCRPMFCSDAELGYALTRKIFNDEMRVIKEARNSLFHSKPISNRIVMITCVEKILNCMNFHLGDFDAAIAQSQYLRPACTVNRQDRHLLPA